MSAPTLNPQPEVWVVLRNSAYLTGHSYATGIGDRYSWSKDPGKAWKMGAEQALSMARRTKGRAHNTSRRRR